MELWRTKDVAREFGVSVATINRWVGEKGLPCIDEFGERRFFPDSVRAWLRSLERTRTTATTKPHADPATGTAEQVDALLRSRAHEPIRRRAPRVTAAALKQLREVA